MGCEGSDGVTLQWLAFDYRVQIVFIAGVAVWLVVHRVLRHLDRQRDRDRWEKR